MPAQTPPTSQLEWLSSTTAMIVLFWSRATRDLLRSFGWGIAALLRENAATKLPFHRRPPHSVFRSPAAKETNPLREAVTGATKVRLQAVAYLPGTDGSNLVPSSAESGGNHGGAGGGAHSKPR